MRRGGWLYVVVLLLAGGCGDWACTRRHATEQVGLNDTEWRSYSFKHLKDREFDERDWEPLFRILKEEPLDEPSLQIAVEMLFQFADGEHRDALLVLLEQRAGAGDMRYTRIAAFYHLMAAMQERDERMLASPEVYAYQLEQAASFARKGAQAGDPFSVNLFGKIVLFDPVRLSVHRAEAISWLRQASNGGDPEARKILSQFER